MRLLRLLVPPVLLLLVAAVAVATAGSTASAARAAACKAGQGRLTVAGRTRCVAAAGLLPATPAAPDPITRWLRVGTDRTLTGRLQQHVLPRRLRPAVGQRIKAAVGKVQKAIVPLGAKVGTALRVPAGAATRGVKEGPVVLTDTPSSMSVKSTLSLDDAGSGTSSTLDVTARARKDASQETDPTIDFELGFTVKDKDKGTARTTELAMPLRFKGDLADRCPSAAGLVRRSSRLTFRRTTRERGIPVGLEYRNETWALDGGVKLTGTVGRDAALKSIAYTSTLKLDYAIAASGLRGAIRGNMQMNIDIAAAGTLNPATGASTGGTTTVTGRLRDINRGAAAEKAEMARALAEPQTRASLLKLVSDMVKREYDGMKSAQTHWQQPNACATMDLTPASATLDEGESAAVSGGVKAQDGTVVDGDWTLATRTRGTAATLPGTSSPAKRIGLTMTADAPGPADRTVDVLLRATSPAGVATAPWIATAPERELFFRVVGASGSQSATGTLADQNCSSIGAPDGVGPWTYAFQATTGAPDGTVSLSPAGANGSVRASGVSTVPAWTWTATCGSPPQTTTQPRDPLSYSGRFGPSVSFFELPGDPATVDVVWDVLAPAPIFQWDLSGPDCTPDEFAAGSSFRRRMPLATLKQRGPFTITMDGPWSTTRTSGFMSTSCTGSTSLSLTLQRVGASGAPLG